MPVNRDPTRIAWQQIASILGYFVLWIFVYVDTMRIDDPTYVFSNARFWRLVLIGIGFVLLDLSFWIPGALLSRALAAPWFGATWPVVLDVLIATKLGYVFFAAEVPEGAFAFSWRITSRAAFVPTLALTATAEIVTRDLEWVVTPPTTSAPIVQAIDAFGFLVVAFVALAFVNPRMIRWMRVAETMQPSVEVPAG